MKGTYVLQDKKYNPSFLFIHVYLSLDENAPTETLHPTPSVLPLAVPTKLRPTSMVYAEIKYQQIDP
jgi:hypothetical protein